MATAAAAEALCDEAAFYRRFAALKRRDRQLPDWLFVCATAALVGLEVALCLRQGLPAEVWLPVAVLSAYAPLNFLFFCNVVGVGTLRELIWMAAFVCLCLLSLARFDSLSLGWIIAPALSLAAYFCWRSFSDPYCRYRKGLRLLEAGAPRRALWHLERALRLAPQEARFAWHLGRAYQRLGRQDQGGELRRQALEREPGLEQSLRSDPLFREAWLA